MSSVVKLVLLVFTAFSLSAPQALAHASLSRSVPGTGSTVSVGLEELTLSFSEGIVVAFAHVDIASSEGDKIPAGKPVADPSDPKILRVKLENPLKPGTYQVTWHVTSVDTHRSKGAFSFTVAP